jgi:putative spermidine/putrescine transport system substrate-binding protein
MKLAKIDWAMGAVLALMAVGVSACGSSSSTTAPRVICRRASIGKGEGQLNLVAWEGYTQPQWVKPFEKQTGCKVHAKYAGSSDEMVTLMRQGGGSQYDMVSASGDASLRLIYGGDVQPDERQPDPGLEELPAAAVAAAQHGQRQALRDLAAVGPEHAALQHEAVKPAPTSWSAIYSPKYKGKITVPTTRSRSPTRRCTCRRRSRRSASPTRTS